MASELEQFVDKWMAVCLAVVTLGSSGVGCSRQETCRSDADCKPDQRCVSTGGILITPRTCLEELPFSDGETTDGDAPDASETSDGFDRQIQFGTAEEDAVTALAVPADTSSHVYIAGYTTGNLADLGSETTTDGTTAFLARWDRRAGLAWIRPVDGAARVHDLEIDRTANALYLAGRSGSGDNRRPFVGRYDTEGRREWADTGDDDGSCGAVDVGPGGDVFAACSLTGSSGDTRATVRLLGESGAISYEVAEGTETHATDLVASRDGVFLSGFGGAALGTADTGQDAFAVGIGKDGSENWKYVSDWEKQDSAYALGVLSEPGGLWVAGGAESIPGQQSRAGGYLQRLRISDSGGGEVEWNRPIPEVEGLEHLVVDPGTNTILVSGGETTRGFAPAGQERPEWKGPILESIERDVHDIVRQGASGRLFVGGKTREALSGMSNRGDLDAFVTSFPRP